ncbi:MAG: hypothetical protein CMM77_04760 [Rhodospirillaceae bacterium]|nr:hypothetical protein [Magnetovibrio sp.]MAY66416.1 hypothetical protein [Rhodospirillaceae bacterium]|tara:strand:+ start:160 stop:525 length:366 start_codon:yes stop_codon:yes gene_type:complete
MGTDEFRRNMNDLEALSLEIEQAPEFKMDPATSSRTELLHRFNLHRAMVNLLHFVTVHMMRADAEDYDLESEKWILSALDKASEDIRIGLARPLPVNVRHLAERAQNLTNGILANIHTIAA